MKKNLSVANLIDLYGSLLTLRQKEIISGYYEYDLSLGEIAENLNITRQAVRDSLSKTTAMLESYENSFNLYKIKNKLSKALTSNENERIIIIKEILEALL